MSSNVRQCIASNVRDGSSHLHVDARNYFRAQLKRSHFPSIYASVNANSLDLA